MILASHNQSTIEMTLDLSLRNQLKDQIFYA